MKLIDGTKPYQPKPGDTIRGKASGNEYTVVQVEGHPGVYLFRRRLVVSKWEDPDKSLFEVIPKNPPATPPRQPLKQGDFVSWKVGDKETEVGVVTTDESAHGYVDMTCLSHGHHQRTVHVQHLTPVAVEEIRYERV